MTRRRFLLIWFVASLSIAQVGCVNLQEIHDYSSRSVSSIKKFEDVQYSFSTACSEKCLIAQLELRQLSKLPCNCDSEKTADNLMMMIYQALKGYFQGLGNLSGNQLTNYKFNTLARSLKEGQFGDVVINKKQVDAYAKIAEIISRSVTDVYRKKKLAVYIGEANDAVNTLAEGLEFILAASLSKRLETQKERLKSFYFDLSVDPASPPYEKKKIIEEYTEAEQELESRKKQIQSYTRGLRTIGKGHQELYENRNRLKARELKNLLVRYTSEIEDIATEFNKIKNE